MSKIVKVTHIAGTVIGGAGRAAWRLHEALLQEGHDSTFFTINDWTEADNIEKKAFKLYNPLPQTLFERIDYKWRRSFLYKDLQQTEKDMYDAFHQQKKDWKYECAAIPFGYVNQYLVPQMKEADAIILHAINGIIDVQHFFADFKNKPVIWTLHDMNAFQGLFHYKEDELRNAPISKKLDEAAYAIKAEAYAQKKRKLTIVAPSQWLADGAKKSKLLGDYDNVCIPYSLNLDTFSVKDRQAIREGLNLKPEHKVALFISDHVQNARKGFDLLMDALSRFNDPDIVLLAIGEDRGDWDIPSNIRFIGKIKDDNLMADYFNAADVFILPSREDNLPNVMLEAFACGCPVIGFPIGGVKEHVIGGVTGKLADNISGDALAKTIDMFFDGRSKFNQHTIRDYAVKMFNPAKQVAAYLDVIEKTRSN